MANELDKRRSNERQKIYTEKRGYVPPEQRGVKYYLIHRKWQDEYRNPRESSLNTLV